MSMPAAVNKAAAILHKFAAWMQQPTSVAGVSGLVGVAVGVATHQLSPLQAAVPLAAALVAILLPDNTQARADVVRLATEIIAASKSGAPGVALAAPRLVADGGAVLADLQAPATK